MIENGRVLLCHRSPNRRWYPDVWDLPGGHVEPGEGAADALGRELCEELGLAEVLLSPGPCDALVTLEFEMRIWRVESWKGTPQNMAPEEHDRIGWFAAAELSSLRVAHPAYFALLRRAFSS
jgi:8-oxo-dGTP diphosphatase